MRNGWSSTCARLSAFPPRWSWEESGEPRRSPHGRAFSRRPSGRIDGRVSQGVALLDSHFAEGDAVRVLGSVERFRDRLHIYAGALLKHTVSRDDLPRRRAAAPQGPCGHPCSRQRSWHDVGRALELSSRPLFQPTSERLSSAICTSASARSMKAPGGEPETLAELRTPSRVTTTLGPHAPLRRDSRAPSERLLGRRRLRRRDRPPGKVGDRPCVRDRRRRRDFMGWPWLVARAGVGYALVSPFRLRWLLRRSPRSGAGRRGPRQPAGSPDGIRDTAGNTLVAAPSGLVSVPRCSRRSIGHARHPDARVSARTRVAVAIRGSG
jgi:hypothetical protein